jgi:hypothetical protein
MIIEFTTRPPDTSLVAKKTTIFKGGKFVEIVEKAPKVPSEHDAAIVLVAQIKSYKTDSETGEVIKDKNGKPTTEIITKSFPDRDIPSAFRQFIAAVDKHKDWYFKQLEV